MSSLESIQENFLYLVTDSDNTLTLQESHEEYGTMSFWSIIQSLQVAGFIIDFNNFTIATEKYEKAKGDLRAECEAVLGRQLEDKEFFKIEEIKNTIDVSQVYIDSHYAMPGAVKFIKSIRDNGGKVAAIVTNNRAGNVTRYLNKIGIKRVEVISAYEANRNKPDGYCYRDLILREVENLVTACKQRGLSEVEIVESVYKDIKRYELLYCGDSIYQDGGMVRNVNRFFKKLNLLLAISEEGLPKKIIQKIIDEKENFYPVLNFVHITNKPENRTFEVDEIIRNRSENENDEESYQLDKAAGSDYNYSIVTTGNFLTLMEYRNLQRALYQAEESIV